MKKDSRIIDYIVHYYFLFHLLLFFINVFNAYYRRVLTPNLLAKIFEAHIMLLFVVTIALLILLAITKFIIYRVKNKKNFLFNTDYCSLDLGFLVFVFLLVRRVLMYNEYMKESLWEYLLEYAALSLYSSFAVAVIIAILIYIINNMLDKKNVKSKKTKKKK